MAIMVAGGRIIGSQKKTGIGASLSGNFDKFQMDVTAKYEVGALIETANGDRFRYAQFDADTNRGVLVAQDFSQVSVVDTDNVVIAPASAVAVSFEPMKPGALGSTVAQVTLAARTLNQFAGAKLIITDDTGEGYTYDIVGNTATDTPASGDIYIFLKQKLQVALTTTSDLSIIANRWNNLEVATFGTDGVVSGVTCAQMVVGTAAFGWVQTKGICGVLQDVTVPGVGAPVQLSAATSGAVAASFLAGTVGLLLKTRIVGYCVDAGDSTGHTSVDLILE